MAKRRIIIAMTTHRWTIAGWIFIAAAVLLAVASVWKAFDALHPITAQPLGPSPAAATVAAPVLMRAIVLGVLAGTAFFTGLACFFWGAAQQRCRRLEQILDRLEARTSNDRPV
jgi:hypothetical protein